jgi:hypothetical protein
MNHLSLTNTHGNKDKLAAHYLGCGIPPRCALSPGLPKRRFISMWLAMMCIIISTEENWHIFRIDISRTPPN